MGDNKHWAQSQLIDPLTAPEPNDETGPNAHFRSTFAPASTFTPTPPASSASMHKSPSVGVKEHTTGGSSSTNPFRRSSGATAYPSPPNSASPRKERFPTSHREEAFSAYNGESSGRRRASSLTARFPGDNSHRPLDIIRKDSKKAHRSPHLSKRHMPRADVIDRLDFQAYHHEGPYDPVLMARNTSFEHSPVAAVAETNAEALRATPKENIQNSIRRHHPLDGTAMVPPGVPDQFGRVYDYEEGTDMMRDLGGDYKRWAGVTYHPDDLKGKGEPSYTIEKALKEHGRHDEGIEMKTRPRNKSLGHSDRGEMASMNSGYDDQDGQVVRRSNTTGKKASGGLKKTFGSLRRRK